LEYSVVIPVFNEEGSLRPLQQELHDAMEKASSDYEIIYVNDGSRDSSLDVLKELKGAHPNIRIVSFSSRSGKSAALVAGFRASKGERIITLDADLQNPPDAILDLLEFKDAFDLMMGARRGRRDNFIRRASSRLAAFSRWLILGDTTKDAGCGLRVFRREVLENFLFFRNFHRFFGYIVRESGFSVKDVEIGHRPRKFGEAKYGTFKRGHEGIFDLVGVFWLKKRKVKYNIDREY